jgi:hypothetical protein
MERVAPFLADVHSRGLRQHLLELPQAVWLQRCFKRHHRPSPFHFKGTGGNMLPAIKQLLKGFTSIDPLPKGQKTVMPKLLVRHLKRQVCVAP